MIVHDFSIANHHMMRQHAAHGFMESASDGFVRNLELRPGFCLAGSHTVECFFYEVKRCGGGVGLEVSSCAVKLNGIAPLLDLPFKFGYRKQSGLRQLDFYAVAGCFNVPDIDQSV